MKFSIETSNNIEIIKPEEEYLEAATATELKSQLVLMMKNKNSKYLCINLSDVEAIDSSGVSALLLAHRGTEALGGFCIIIGLKKRVLDILDLAGLSKQLYIFPTLEEAQKHISSNDN